MNGDAGPSVEFLRGKEAGEVLTRLADHDRHFGAINGSIDKLGDEVHALIVTLQRFSDAADARDAVTIATAKALAESELARRGVAERKWSKYQKIFAVFAALATVITVATALYAVIHK